MARSPLQEVQRRIGFLQGISFDDGPSRFEGFLSWMESEPAILLVLTNLRQSTDLDKLTEGCGFHSPPKLRTPNDVARVGLFIMEYSRENPQNLPGLLFNLGCHDSSCNNFHVDFQNALDKYINPFLNYLQEELQSQPSTISLDTVVEYRRKQILDAAFSRAFPETSRLWQNLSKEMTAFTDSENWFNIANSCREVLKAFAQEFQKKSGLTIPDTVKAGDFKGIMRHVLSGNRDRSRERDAIASLATAAWDYVQILLHNKDASRIQAIRGYLWTGMVIAEISTMINPEATGIGP